MRNKILDIQNVIIKQIERLDNDTIMDRVGKDEIARANALTNASTIFIKTINTQLAILNTAVRLNEKPEELQKELGICEEE